MQKVRRTPLEWDIGKPDEFIKAYVQLREIARQCRKDFSDLLKRTKHKRQAIANNEATPRAWRSTCFEADDMGWIVEESIDEDEDVVEGEDSEDSGSDLDVLHSEAERLALKARKNPGKKPLPLKRVHVMASNILQDSEAEEEDSSSVHDARLLSWVNEVEWQ